MTKKKSPKTIRTDTQKTVKAQIGEVDVKTPRNRNSEYKPQNYRNELTACRYFQSAKEVH